MKQKNNRKMSKKSGILVRKGQKEENAYEEPFFSFFFERKNFLISVNRRFSILCYAQKIEWEKGQ